MVVKSDKSAVGTVMSRGTYKQTNIGNFKWNTGNLKIFIHISFNFYETNRPLVLLMQESTLLYFLVLDRGGKCTNCCNKVCKKK